MLYICIYSTFRNFISFDRIHIQIFKMYLILIFYTPSGLSCHFLSTLNYVQHHLLTRAVQKNEVRRMTCKLEQNYDS